MASIREHIRMTDAELGEFLAEPNKLQLGTIGPDGWPHMVTMYFAPVDGKLAFWTYKTSQKAKNLERDNRVTCLIETGEGYDQLRGVMLKGVAERVDELALVRSLGEQVYGRYMGDADGKLDPAMGGFLDDQARKRYAYLVTPSETASWDHRKLVTMGHTPDTAVANQNNDASDNSGGPTVAHIEANYDVCEANGLCELAAPELFRLNDDDTLTVLQADVPAELLDKAREAVDRCPKVALRLREDA